MTATVPAVQAGQGEQRGRGVVAVGARVEAYHTVGEGGGERAQGAFRFGLREDGGLGEEVGEAAARGVERLAVPAHEPLGLRRARQCPHRQFVGIGGSRGPQPRPGGDQWREPFVAAEPLVDGVRIGVEVEEPPQPPHAGGQVARVGEMQPGVQPAARMGTGRGLRRAGALVDGDDAGAVR